MNLPSFKRACLSLGLAALVLSGCASGPKPEQYAQESPKLE